MDVALVMYWLGNVDYAAIALVAVWGAFCVILVHRQLNRRRFRTKAEAGEFSSQLFQLLRAGRFDDADRLAGSPEHWYKAIPVLVREAIENRHLGPRKVRQTTAAAFEREILTELENRLAWVNTVIKCAPLLGLLGTVIGMIGAFDKIYAGRPDPSQLAGDISVALITTFLGLCVAIPLLLASNFVQIRMRALEDAVVEQMEAVFSELETNP
jgi:biopolymer transport protein ExbB/TolQ